MHNSYLLAIDQGTSGTKALIVDQEGHVICTATAALKSSFPRPGFVEQDPEEIIGSVLSALEECLERFDSLRPGSQLNIITCGISNQRETFVLWDKSGRPLCQAIVWQCKRSVGICEELISNDELADKVRDKTGLRIDPYFSATKLLWLLRHDQSVKQAVDGGKAYFGTIDTWLLYRFTNGEVYATDHTNASRTLLYNIHELKWDEELLSDFGLSYLNLPEVYPSAHSYGQSDFQGAVSRQIPITAMIGDSHAAAFGEGCIQPGMAKATLGTGCSVLWNTGPKPQQEVQGMVKTICWSVVGRVDYALEGVIVSCGATIEWLRNQLGLYENHEELMLLVEELDGNDGVYLIPAFSGLGAPYWQMDRRASIHGLTFQSDRRHLLRAGLESVIYQIKDVIGAMEEGGHSLRDLRVDGGLTNNEFVMRHLASLLNKRVVKVGTPHVSGLGAAFMAGLGVGVYGSPGEVPQIHESQYYEPSAGRSSIQEGYQTWTFLVDGYDSRTISNVGAERRMLQ